MSAILIIAAIAAAALGYKPFKTNFMARFERDWMHGEIIVCAAIALLSGLFMNGGDFFVALFYIACAVLVGLGIRLMVRYGFGWGLGAWLYNILAVALVFVAVAWMVYQVLKIIDWIKGKR